MSDFTFTSFHIAPNIAEYSFLEISLTVRLFLSILLTIPFSFAIKYLLNLQPVFLLNSRPIYIYRVPPLTCSKETTSLIYPKPY